MMSNDIKKDGVVCLACRCVDSQTYIFGIVKILQTEIDKREGVCVCVCVYVCLCVCVFVCLRVCVC